MLLISPPPGAARLFSCPRSGPIGSGDWSELCIVLGQVCASIAPVGALPDVTLEGTSSGSLFLASAKNHPFAVCALALLGTTIWLLLSRAPLFPLQGMATRLFSCPYSPPCRVSSSWPGATLHAYNRKLLCASVLTPRVAPAAYGAGTLNRGGLRTGAAPADRITDYGICGDLSPTMLTPSGAWPTDARSPLPPRVRGQFWVRIVATYRPGYPSLGIPALVRSCALLSVVPVWSGGRTELRIHAVLRSSLRIHR